MFHVKPEIGGGATISENANCSCQAFTNSRCFVFHVKLPLHSLSISEQRAHRSEDTGWLSAAKPLCGLTPSCNRLADAAAYVLTWGSSKFSRTSRSGKNIPRTLAASPKVQHSSSINQLGPLIAGELFGGRQSVRSTDFETTCPQRLRTIGPCRPFCRPPVPDRSRSGCWFLTEESVVSRETVRNLHPNPSSSLVPRETIRFARSGSLRSTWNLHPHQSRIPETSPDSSLVCLEIRMDEASRFTWNQRINSRNTSR